MTPTFTDEADWFVLTTQILEGDESAFAYFYNHFFDRLFRYTLVMTAGDEELSKELLQQTMLKAVRYLKPLREEAVVWSWLTQVAKTSYIDVLRSRKRAPAFVGLELVTDLSTAADKRIDENAVLEAALDRALKELGAEDQRLIENVYFNELSHKEIADSLNVTAKAV
jgi:RNA polymerase sigma-70 factor (ECF subfamily)